MIQHPLIEIPNDIKNIQEWFASVIKRPLIQAKGLNPISPSGKLIIEEAKLFITESCNLPSHKRIEIYNQQYWYRLFNFLQVNFPLTIRLLGYENFNKIATDFLVQHPPNDWSLITLADNFPIWIKDQNFDKKIEHAIQIDERCYSSSIAAKHPSVKLADFVQIGQSNFFKLTFFLQPHLSLINFPYDLLSYREDIIKQDLDFFIENKPPELIEATTQYFVVFRTSKNTIAWQNISQEETELLKLFKNGCTLLEACDYIEQQETIIKTILSESIQKYFKEWILLDWLTLDN